ncbi:MAG: hypothetical protein HF967_09610 [Methanosarcinales archaeon]|nr:hypothetical protein [Methanosarcinales archaeon]
MNKKLKVSFIENIEKIFTEHDIKFIQKYFYVMVADFVLRLKQLKDILKTIIDMIKGILWTNGTTFSWFVNFHTFIAVLPSKIFRKKSIAIAKGYGVAKVPDMKCDAMLNSKCTHAVWRVLEGVYINKIDNAINDFEFEWRPRYIFGKKNACEKIVVVRGNDI